MKWLDVIHDSERRLTPRQPRPPILAYYWDGSTPRTHQVRDISHSGVFVITPERWYIGTLIKLTLVLDRGMPLAPLSETPDSEAMFLYAKAVRHGDEGVGLEFVIPHAAERAKLKAFLGRAAELPGRASKANSASAAEAGQALVEFALMLPLLLLFIVNAVNFGGFLYDWITVANAARAGVQYQVLSSSASVGNPNSATNAQVVAAVTQDVSSLPNRASIKVQVCTNNNGTSSCAGTGPAPAALAKDPEAPYYVVASVDVTYTYTPFIALWDFNALGIHATLPSSTIHRRAIMRMIQ